MLSHKSFQSNFLKILKWIFSIVFLFISIVAITTGSLPSGICFLVISLLLIPSIMSYVQKKIPSTQSFITKTILIFLLFIVAVIALPKKKNKNKAHNEKAGKISQISPIQKLEGLVPADVFKNFEKKGFKTTKQIATEGSFWISTFKSNGIDYEVKTFCEKGVSAITSVRLTATRITPQYNKEIDMKPFLSFGSTVPYDNSKPEIISKFIDQNYYNDKATIEISNVKFTIYAPTEFMRMMTIEPN